MKKEKTLLDSFNDNIYKFIADRLLYEIDSEIVLKKIKEILIKDYIYSKLYFTKTSKTKNFYDIFDDLNPKPQSALDYFYEELITVFKENELPSNINIKFSKIFEYLPKNKNFINFIKDYLHIQKEIILFFLPLTFMKVKEDEYNNFKWVREKMYEDSYYLQNLNSNKINQKIDLICLINNDNFYDDLMIIEYNNINKLYFIFDDNNENKNYI